MTITSIGTGQMISRTDILSYRTISAIGAAFTTIGAVLISLWNENTGRGPQIIHMIISGIGIGGKILWIRFFLMDFSFS